MTTTTFIVEMVIIGIQVMVWLLMIIVYGSNPSWFTLDNIEKLSALIAVVGVGVAGLTG